MQKPFTGKSKSLAHSKQHLSYLWGQSGCCWVMNASPRDTEIWIISLQTGSVVDATGAGLEGIVEAVTCARPELLPAWQSFKKWWPKSLPFAKCEYFVAKRNAALWFLHSSWFPCVGGKKGQECEWYKISYVLKKPKEAMCLSYSAKIQFKVWCPCDFSFMWLRPSWFSLWHHQKM